ncbi:MAG: mechanosensitive ion channel family protein [Kiritimatiellae bacterium]|nr:mechanosensitive ion channel family protein [Kiritimatiellia bacterium]
MNEAFASGVEFIDYLKGWMMTQGVGFMTALLTAAVIFAAGWLIIRLLNAAVHKALGKYGHKTLFANFVASVVTKSCWAILLITVLSRLGVDVTPLIAGLGVTGFILGFAFQESLGNLASGMMIAINEPFKVGDFVEAAGMSGTIAEVNMMATVMTTPDNKRIVMPNKSVWGSPITNYSAQDTRRVDMQMGIAYGEDVERALDVMLEAVNRVPGVLAEPAASVSVAGLDSSQITVNIRPWAKNADYWTVRSATLAAVKAELNNAGIEIPFPQVVVHTAAK